MKIVVLVKHVPDATGERSFAADGTVDRAASDGLLSELDEYALEQALQIADDGDDVEVVAMTVGPDDAADGDQAIAADGGLGRHPHQRRRRCTAPTRSRPARCSPRRSPRPRPIW